MDQTMRRGGRGDLAAPPREARPYFCRECQATVSSQHIPEGWYTLTRQVPSAKFPQFNSTRIGHFCSAACLTGHLGRINSIEAKRDVQP